MAFYSYYENKYTLLQDLWRYELKKFKRKVEIKGNTLIIKKLKKKSFIFTSSAIALALSACGRETRSTTDVPLADETTNVPTAYNDKLVGSDDLDTFTALAGDDEIYGFGGNDQIIAGLEMIPFMAVMGTIIFSQELATIKFMVKEERHNLSFCRSRY